MELLVFLPVFASLGLWLSKQKHRNPMEGFLLGMLLGPFGVVLAGMAPTLPSPTSAPVARGRGWRNRRSEWSATPKVTSRSKSARR